MTKRQTVNPRGQFRDFPDRNRGGAKHGLAPEDERELTMRTTAALAAFGAPVEIVVKDEIATRGARIDAGDDYSLALLEFQGDLVRGRGKRIDVFLAPDSDLDVEAGERRQLRTRLRLYSIVEKPAPDYIAVIPDLDTGAWLKPTMAALKRALKPVIAEIERRPLN
jgi:hypothetical protein